MRFLALLSLLFILKDSCLITTPSNDGALWITAENTDTAKPNQWLAFSKTFEIIDNDEPVILKIAADTKYWMWLNGEMIVREGGLKWGPTATAYYYDEIELTASKLKESNQLSIALWYFGKDGFAHMNHQKAGLLVHSNLDNLNSNASWNAGEISCFLESKEGPQPNWRLAESNIYFKADQEGSSESPFFGCKTIDFGQAVVLNTQSNIDIKRSIPQWKDYGRKDFDMTPALPFISNGDTLTLELPFNMQCTPYFRIRTKEHSVIDVRTDNYRGGSEYNMRTNYEASIGLQEFETPGWINGHEIRYHFPEGVEVLEVGYRESGYDTEFSGKFECNDSFYNELWEKSARTLYVTMRDNFMDCPDRERAQWWGDAVLQLGQCPYVFDRKSDLLIKKAIYELMLWQKDDGVIFSPVPAGNWDKELPTQMLASVGYYGFWTYYMNTGDLATIKELYPYIKRYLEIWEIGDDGLVIQRNGGWTWGDWGNHKDMPLIFNGWYYLALKGQALMARELALNQDADLLEMKMAKLAQRFNEEFWNGEAYRSKSYQGETDERGQALAVLSGIANSTKYSLLTQAIIQGEHCSPYFEKYVYEALIQMGHPGKALTRMKERYTTMVESPITTLWEGWQVGSSTWGGGTYNHSWSGGALTILSREIAGIKPMSPGFDTIQIKPQLGELSKIKTEMMTPHGMLKVNVAASPDRTLVEYDAPKNVTVIVKN